ncbi:hypothetical protein ACC685_38780, partial [Rhizobium ruizarguesonis]
MTIYRHMAPGTQTETGTNFAGLVVSSTVSQNNRLSYFLVGADGIFKGVAPIIGPKVASEPESRAIGDWPR